MAGIGPNTVPALLAIAVLVLGVNLLWRPGEPPIFLLLFGLNWLQLSVGAFYANIVNIDINQTTAFPADVYQATILSQIGLATLAIGMRLGAGRWRPDAALLAHKIASLCSLRAIFRLYLLSFAATFFCEGSAYIIPGLSQLLLSVVYVKWAFFWLLAYATFCQPNSSKTFFLFAFLLELGWGIGGFFSDFKTVFFVSMLALTAARVRISPSAALGLFVLSIFALVFAIVWTSVKMEYREFVNMGERSQVVAVGFSERMAKLAGLVEALDSEALADGASNLVRRITYVEFFGAVLEYVPLIAPHENGAIWGDALVRPFTPRLIFPNKAVIDDSERTNKYTGLGVSGSESGTSISLGYMAEAYIDFGEVGMMAPLMLLGLFYGYLYKWFSNMSLTRGVLGFGLASAILQGGIFAETSITKSLGGFIVAVIIAWLSVKYAGPKFFPWLQVRYRDK